MSVRESPIPVDADGQMVCHTWRGFHIPGCMGCAATDHHGCTCRPRDRAGEPLAEWRERIEARITALEREVTE